MISFLSMVHLILNGILKGQFSAKKADNKTALNQLHLISVMTQMAFEEDNETNKTNNCEMNSRIFLPYEILTMSTECWLAQKRCHEFVTVHLMHSPPNSTSSFAHRIFTFLKFPLFLGSWFTCKTFSKKHIKSLF